MATAMVDIDEFLPQVLLYAPNANDLVVYRFIIEAARELCERCKFWRESDTLVLTAPDMQSIITVTDANIVKIETASLDGQTLEAKAIAWLDVNVRDWSTTTDEGGPARYVTQLQPDTVTVVPKIAGTLLMRLILQPSLTATTLPAFLLQDYATEIGRGAAGKFLTTPSPDANPQSGLDHRSWFASRLDALAMKSTKGQQSAPLRTRGRYL